MVQALRELTDTAPDGLAGNVLAEAGLIDAYAEVAGPIGPLYIAWGPTGVTLVERAGDPMGFELEASTRTGRPIRRVDHLPARLGRRVEHQLAGERTEVPEVDLGGLTQFEQAVLRKTLEIPGARFDRTPGWPARSVGLGRCARSARRWPATPSPSSSPATAWCAPMVTSASTARVGPPPSEPCWRWRAWMRMSWSGWPAPASATWVATRPRSTATPRAAMRGASPIATACRSARPRMLPTRATGPARTAGR